MNYLSVCSGIEAASQAFVPRGWKPVAFSEIEPFPSAVAVCSLSDILETGDVPQRFFLTAKACQGILRRADKRGKALPEVLSAALKAVASQT